MGYTHSIHKEGRLLQQPFIVIIDFIPLCGYLGDENMPFSEATELGSNYLLHTTALWFKANSLLYEHIDTISNRSPQTLFHTLKLIAIVGDPKSQHILKKAYGFNDRDIEILRCGMLLHDNGKGDERILPLVETTRKFDAYDLMMMEKHSYRGRVAITDTTAYGFDTVENQRIRKIVLHHHLYPFNVRGLPQEGTLERRLCEAAIVLDVTSACQEIRSYRQYPLPYEETAKTVAIRLKRKLTQRELELVKHIVDNFKQIDGIPVF